jgi:hypothetical protein
MKLMWQCSHAPLASSKFQPCGIEDFDARGRPRESLQRADDVA